MAETTPPAPSSMQVDPALVRQLADLLNETQLTEIEVQDGERRIRVARQPGYAGFVGNEAYPAMAGQPAPMPGPAAGASSGKAAPSPAESTPADDHPGTVKSPMVGTAYLAAEPGSKPFADVGDKVEAGATLLIVEAMKVMNPILSPRAGTIRAVFIANGQPVEFDQPLIVVD